MNPPIPKSVCEEEMQNANLDTNEVIIEYITDAHGNEVKKLQPLLTLITLHGTIVVLSRLVQKVPLLELLHATEFSMRLV